MAYSPNAPIHAASEPLTENAFDAVGSYQSNDPKPLGRPLYPYGHGKGWYGHDADVETWGELLELPQVRPGWLLNSSVSIFQPTIDGVLSSGGLLEDTFPGSPVVLSSVGMNWTASPEIEAGYRFEHGLGELRVSYQFWESSGTSTVSSALGDGIASSEATSHVMDIDYVFLEFNPEGLPLIPPMTRNFGRFGLGRTLTPEWLCKPVEIRWIFGARFTNLAYGSRQTFASSTETAHAELLAGGLHFALQLDQQLTERAPIFLHTRLEGSGIWGNTNQEFSRTLLAPINITRTEDIDSSLGVPSVDIEIGLGWSPSWPRRNLRLIAAYQYEKWFRFADFPPSNPNLTAHGMVLRGEWNF